MSSSSRSRDALKALSVLGGLYRLKNCSGSFSENVCDSIAASASKWNPITERCSLTPEIEVQVLNTFQMPFRRRTSELREELIRYCCLHRGVTYGEPCA